MDVLAQAGTVADAVRALPRTVTTALIAVDGPGGSGKTTLAAAVADRLGGCPVIAGDDFYRPMPDDERERLTAEQGYHRYFDWQRLRDEALAPLRAGKPAGYQRYDWATGELRDGDPVAAAPVVLVEGVYAARPELFGYYQHTTYVDTPREICLHRLRLRGENPPDQIMRWRAAEDHYIHSTAPQTRVHLVVRGY